MAVAEQPLTSVPAKQKQVSQSYWSLVWWKFKRNHVAVVGGVILFLFYTSFVIIPEFVSPYRLERISDFVEAPPHRIHFFDEQGSFHLQPFVYGFQRTIGQVKRNRTYAED